MEDKLILLVEDNPHIMAINDAALHMRGYRTLQAETAHKCRELLCFHAVDLIVLDILLPDGDGVALLISLDDRDFATYAHGAKAEEIFSDAVLQDLELYFLDNFGNDDWYGGFSDFVSGCEWYLQHVAEGGEAGVPVHNEVEISDSTQEDTADDSFTLGGAFGLSLLISCVAALIVCMVFRSQMKSVRTQTTANQYVGNDGLNLTLSRDIYRYTSQKRRQIPRNDNNNNSTGGGHGGAGFSGSISHTSSSGHGRSGKF